VAYEPIGRDGNVSCTWSDYGASFPFPFCASCTAPPLYYGKNASRCECCTDNLSNCDEWESSPCTGSGDAEQLYDNDYDGGCDGGYSYFHQDRRPFAPEDITVISHGGGEVGMRAVVRLNDNYDPYPRYRYTWSWEMKWACGLIGDVVRGQCKNPACNSGDVTVEDGVCASSLGESIVRIPGAGVSEISDDYDCPCNCYQPHWGYCDAKEWIRYSYYLCPEQSAATPIDDLWTRHFESAPIKSNPRHPLAHDAFEIGDSDESCYCFTYENQPFLGDIDGVTFDLFGCGRNEGDDTNLWWPYSLNSDACQHPSAGDCDECPNASAMRTSDGAWDGLINGCMYHPAIGNVLSDSSGPGSVGYCSRWTCAKSGACSSAVETGSWLLEDPVLIPYGVCAIVLNVEVMSQSGNCADGPGQGPDEKQALDNVAPVGCTPTCGDASLPSPGSCGTTTATVGLTRLS